MAGRRKQDINKHRAYSSLREYKASMLTIESLHVHGAHAMGIGRKFVKGKSTDQLTLRIYVPKKLPSSRLSSEEKIPNSIPFLSRHAKRNVTLVTDVIEAPPVQLDQFDPSKKNRPVPGGAGGGIRGDTGTIGGWVWDRTDDTVVMLSNNHVFRDTQGEDIIQPGSYFGGSSPADKIGEVKRGIVRSKDKINTVDCAIGDPDNSNIYDLNVPEIGPAIFAVETPVLDTQVEKYGLMTHHTFGEIIDVDWQGTISGMPFDDCLFIDPVSPSNSWSAKGDSGSLIFSQTPIPEDSGIKPVVGLHFGHSGDRGVGCKIQSVFSSLDLTTLSAGAFPAFFDALFEAETDGSVSGESESRLRAISAMATRTATRFSPQAFARRERIYRTRGFHTGISHDMYHRLIRSARGRTLTDFVSQNRAELLSLLAKDGDIRRATVAAFRPILAGATTTTDVLDRALTAQDLDRLDKLAREVSRKSSPKLRTALNVLQTLKPNTEGKTLANILRIRP